VCVVAMAVAMTASTACGGGDDDGSRPMSERDDSPSTSTSMPPPAPRYDTAGALVGAHDCIVGDPAKVRVAWAELRNPVFATDHMTKDETVRVVDGRWYLLFSERWELDEPEGERTPAVASVDLATWEPATDVVGDPWGSPDITRDEAGRYVVTFQLRDPDNDELSKIFYRTASNPAGPWNESRRLVPGMFADERVIDAAVARTE
jgi:hypothetical protein